MSDGLNWERVASRYLTDRRRKGDLAAVVASIRDEGPLAVTTGLQPDAAEREKSHVGEFFLLAVWDAVSDHALTDTEVAELVHVQRLLRIQEGDLVSLYEDEVRRLLCAELARLLEDYNIDPEEATHKVRLQEVVGLSYDEFVQLTSTEVDRVILDLLRIAESGAGGELSETDLQWISFQERLRALDTVYDLNAGGGVGGPRSGYLYALLNPSMPGLVKIGRTGRSPDDRVRELTSATGVPQPFVLICELLVDDVVSAEAWVHSELGLRGSRASPDREFFAIKPSEAVELLLRARDEYKRG